MLATGCVLASCSTTNYAVRVGNAEYSQTQLVSQINAFYASPSISGNLTSGVNGTPGTKPTQVSAGVANSDISFLVVEQLLKVYHAKVNSFERTIAQNEIDSSLTSTGQAARVDPIFKKFLIDESAASIALGASEGRVSLNAKIVEKYYYSHPDLFKQVCLQDALFQTQSQAQNAVNTIKAGSSFGSAIAGSSQSSATNPSPTCGSYAALSPNIVSAISTLQPGQVSPPQPVSGPPSTGSPVTTGYVIYYEVSIAPPAKYGPTDIPIASTTMLENSSRVPITNLIDNAVKSYVLKAAISVNPADGILKIGKLYPLGYTVTAPQGPAANLLPTTTTTLAAPSTTPLG